MKTFVLSLLIAIPLCLVFEDLQAEPVLLGKSSSPYPTGYTTQRHIFHVNGRWFVFFHVGSKRHEDRKIVYVHSEDGKSFSDPVVVAEGVAQIFHVIERGGKIHLTCVDPNQWTLFYSQGSAKDGKISFSDRVTVHHTGISFAVQAPYCELDSEGKPWISWRWQDTETKAYHVYVSVAREQVGASWKDPVDITDLSLSRVGAGACSSILFRLESDKMAVLYCTDKAKLGFSLFSDDKWTQSRLDVDYAGTHDLSAVMDIAGTIHAVFRAQGGAMMYMQYAKDAWSEPVKIDGPAHIHSLSLGMDSKGGLYAFLARPGGVRVSRRIEGSWQPTKMIAKDAFSPYFWTATSVGAPAVAVVWCEGEGPWKEPFEIRLAVLNP